MSSRRSLICFLVVSALLLAGYISAQIISAQIRWVSAYNPGDQNVGQPFSTHACTFWNIVGGSKAGETKFYVNTLHEVGPSSGWCNAVDSLPPLYGTYLDSTDTYVSHNISTSGTYQFTATSYIVYKGSTKAGPKSGSSGNFQVK